MYALTAATLLAANVSGLSVGISSPQHRVLIGEPVALTVRWTATKDVDDVLLTDVDFHAASLIFEIDDGREKRLYREHPHNMDDKLLVSGPMKQGQEEVANLVLYMGGYVRTPRGEAENSFVFSTPGEYSLRAQYVDGDSDAVTDVSSNTLEFVVAAPGGGDAAILKEIRREPRLVTGKREMALVKGLVRKHASSPYLRLARLGLLEHRGDELHNQRNPDSGESISPLGKEGMRTFRSRYYRRLVDEILSRKDWGPFDEQALALAHQYSFDVGDRQLEQGVRTRLISQHPNSVTVRRIQKQTLHSTVGKDVENPSQQPSK